MTPPNHLPLFLLLRSFPLIYGLFYETPVSLEFFPPKLSLPILYLIFQTTVEVPPVPRKPITYYFLKKS